MLLAEMRLRATFPHRQKIKVTSGKGKNIAVIGMETVCRARVSAACCVTTKDP